MRSIFTLALIALLLSGCGGGGASPTSSPSPKNSASPVAGAHEESGHDHGAEEEHGEEGEHSEEEGFVTPNEAQIKEIGLATVQAGGEEVSETARTGRVEPDPDRSVIVSPQVAGTIKDLPVIVGSRVLKGDTLAVLESPDIVTLKGTYHNAQVEVDLATKELDNKESLFRLGDESRREVEEARLQIAESEANRDAVKARLWSAKLTHERLAQLKAEGIASAQQVEQALAERKALEADLRKASTAVEVGRQHLQRESRIANSDLRRKAETFPASASLSRARENLKHLEEQLLQLGADLGGDGTVALKAPIDGQVIKRPVNRGQMVDAGTSVVELVDPSQVWVIIDLTRGDLATSDVGDRVTVSLVNDAKVRADGEISYIDPLVDSESQTVKARVELRESTNKFRVGSFINATLHNQDNLPSLPKEAVQEVEGETVVYISQGKGYRRTPVKVVAEDATRVRVSGLPKGSSVVTRGANDLKSMDMAGSIGGHSH